MNNKLGNLIKLIGEFEKMAQQVSAQPGDIQTALEKAGLWNASADVSPLLSKAGVADDQSINISIVVSPGPSVSFSANVDPGNPNTSGRLAALLSQKYAGAMAKAIKAANLTVSDHITVNWLKF